LNIISVGGVVVWNLFLIMDWKTSNQVQALVELVGIGKKIDLLNHHYYPKQNHNLLIVVVEKDPSIPMKSIIAAMRPTPQ
jgi:hypothetical protein